MKRSAHAPTVKELPSFEERVTAFAREALQAAESFPAGPEKDELLKKAQTAKNIDAWANLPSLPATE
jgi:hypothetical protein